MSSLKLLLDRDVCPHHVPLLYAEDEGAVDLVEPDEIFPDLSPVTGGDVELALTHPLKLVSGFLNSQPLVGIGGFLSTRAGFLYDPEAFENPGELGSDNNLGCFNLPGEIVELALAKAGAPVGEISKNLFSNLAGTTKNTIKKFEAGEFDLLAPAGIIPEGVLLQSRNSRGDFWFWSDFELPEIGSLVLVSNSEFSESNPNLVREAMESIYQSLNKATENRGEAASYFAQKEPDKFGEQSLEILTNSSLGALKTDLSQDHNLYSSWAELLGEETSSSDYVNFDQLLDERFIPLEAIDYSLDV